MSNLSAVPLIVSYSYSGNTHQIAREIQAATGGDRCEIHPWQPYPTAFPELLEQVKREAGSRPRLLPSVLSPHPYSIVFAGSPNWCGTIAPPLAAWLYRNDLSGKLILPFYSHCGGAVGDIRGDIAKLCPEATVAAPLGVTGDGGDMRMKIIRQWLSSVGMESCHGSKIG